MGVFARTLNSLVGGGVGVGVWARMLAMLDDLSRCHMRLLDW